MTAMLRDAYLLHLHGLLLQTGSHVIITESHAASP